jgi:hypothetical protein
MYLRIQGKRISLSKEKQNLEKQGKEEIKRKEKGGGSQGSEMYLHLHQHTPPSH